MRKIIIAIMMCLSVCMLSNSVYALDSDYDVSASENSPRSSVRQVYSRVSCYGYYAIIEGTYEVNSAGNAVNPNLWIYPESSDLSILSFSYTPSGNNISVMITFSSPNGGASLVTTVRENI